MNCAVRGYWGSRGVRGLGVLRCQWSRSCWGCQGSRGCLGSGGVRDLRVLGI